MLRVAISVKFYTMKKKITFLLFLLPIVLFAQTEIKGNTLIIDFGKKKPKQDTVQKQQPVKQEVPEDEEESFPKQKKEKKAAAASQSEDAPDFKKEGVFKGLFHAGINASQIDGDKEYGYKYLGFHGGIGAMVRFHRNISVSMEMNYSMKGAKARYTPAGRTPQSNTLQKYMASFDYIDVPVSLNVHDKKLVMISLGLTPAVLVRYKELDYSGNDVSSKPPYGSPIKFDLSAFAGFHFVIKQHFLLGGKFSYSLIKLRPSYPGTKVNGQYHNVLTFRFMYILDKTSFKKKK